jgi:Protein of unknown function (DUF3887)/Reverse transcriptase (RNA-dependent DNA polymerase)
MEGHGRAQTRENIAQSHMHPTQSGKRMSQGLDGVRKAAKERKQERFTALLHHLNVDLLRDSFYALQRKASPGVDGVTWQEYETGLEDRLVDLHSRVHRGAYRAKPSRRVFIPKADGRQRPLGIAALEDKIVQQAVVTILNQIYEVDFKGFSYGFRPGRSPHQALDALTEDIANKSGVATGEDQLNLGNEYEFGRKLELALSHFNAALRLSGKDYLMKATADTRIGKLNFYGISGSTKQEGRKHFEEAERALGKPTSMQNGIALVQSLGIRSWVECSFGDPALGQQARARAQDELTVLAQDPAVSTQLIDTYKVSLATGLNNTHCAETTKGVIPLSGTTLPSVPPTSGSTNKIELSNRMMGLLVARNFAAFEGDMTATAQSQIPASRLESIWEQVLTIAGPYKQILDTKTNVVNNITFYIVHARFERSLVNLALTFDEANRVSYILITPLSALPRSEIEHRALGVVTDFFQEKFNDVFSGFDASLKSQISASQLQAFFMQVTNASGRFDHVVVATKDRDLDVVEVLCRLQGGRTTVRVAYDADMKIGGFWIMPGK